VRGGREAQEDSRDLQKTPGCLQRRIEIFRSASTITKSRPSRKEGVADLGERSVP